MTMMAETTLERKFRAGEERRAQLALVEWHDMARWLDYAAEEFVADRTTAGYLHHVGQCVREEGERRFAAAAGLAVANAA